MYVDFDADGEKVTVIRTGQRAFDKAGKDAYSAIAKRIIVSKFAGKVMPLGTEDLARITKASGGEYAYPAKSLDKESQE